MDRTTMLLGLVVVIFAVVVYGVVAVAIDPTGSNTKNAVTPGPALPPGFSAPAKPH